GGHSAALRRWFKCVSGGSTGRDPSPLDLSPGDLAAFDLALNARIASLRQRRADIAKFLRALSGVHLGRIEVALGVDGEIVHPMELAGVPTVAPEGADDLAGFTHERAHFVVGAVGVEQEGLLAVDPEIQVPDRA